MTAAPGDLRNGTDLRGSGWAVLLVEDDDGDAFLVEELIAESGVPVQLSRVRTMAEALVAAPAVQCVLLDLGLPDSHGISALRALLSTDPRSAVVVLTGQVDEHRGDEAVAAGAQDYLVKGQVDGRSLLRAVRYAIERKRADEAALALRESSLQAAENARLERGLLPRALIRGADLRHAVGYRPGNRKSLLGGDFYDMVQTSDDRVHVLIGDVCGHGPDEAALGVGLRIAWRTLVLAGVPETVRLAYLQDLLVSERSSPELFATVCALTVAPDRRSVRMRLAGHPPPALLTPDLRALPDDEVGPPLGILDDDLPDQPLDVELPERWALLLTTDGLLEARDTPGGEPLGWEGVLPEVGDLLRTADPVDLPARLVDRVEARNGGPLTDDVALLVLVHAIPYGRLAAAADA